MPKISEFFGITIQMFYREHMPPHFHAVYGEYTALIQIDNLTLYSGKLPPRAMGLVIEWASIHKEKLLDNWYVARNKKPLNKIEPLI